MVELLLQLKTPQMFQKVTGEEAVLPGVLKVRLVGRTGMFVELVL